MSALECSSSRRLRLRTTVALMLVALMLTAAVTSLSAASEEPSVEWRTTFSGLSNNSVIQTADGGYAILAHSETYSRTVLIKTDLSGELQWEKGYDSEVFEDGGTAVSVVQTWDLGYVLFGTGGYIVKTDAEGNVQSKTSLGVVGEVSFGTQASDGRYLLVGNKRETNGENVAWLLRTDEQGKILWNATFTGGFSVNCVIDTNDQGCAIAGNWNNHFWLAKIDSNSNLEWSQRYAYGEPSDFHFVSSVAKTTDGGYLLVGGGDWQSSGGIVPWLVKINFYGNEQWSLPYGHILDNSFTSVVQTADEGYLLALKHSPDLVKTDSSGSQQWTLTYTDISGENGEIPRLLDSSLIRTKDGGFVIASTDFRANILLTKISPEPDALPPVVSISSPKSKTYDTGDIQLTFTVNEPASSIGYSLNGQDNVTIAGNTTLSGLTTGEYDLIVYATAESGKTGASVTIQFTLADRFPIEWIIVSIVAVAVVGVCLLVYFKKQSLLAYKKQGLMSCFKRQLIAIANNNIVRNLTLIGLCITLILVQFFFPYFYFSSLSGNSTSTFEVGISYVYEQDNIEQIYAEVSRIKDLGFKIIRVNMCKTTDPNHYLNSVTDVFFGATQYFDMRVALIIPNYCSTNEIQYYLSRWGKYLSYVQILNEPESSSSWDVGALFTDDEVVSRFEQVYAIVETYNLPVQLYTNFEVGFVVRTNLPIKFSEKLDFVGFDVFMDSFLVLSPNFVQLLREITNKEVVITEFGMSTSDDIAQSDFIIRGLNLFKSMGLRGCWIVYWNSVENNYGIRGRLAEETVGEWIAQNT